MRRKWEIHSFQIRGGSGAYQSTSRELGPFTSLSLKQVGCLLLIHPSIGWRKPRLLLPIVNSHLGNMFSDWRQWLCMVLIIKAFYDTFMIFFFREFFNLNSFFHFTYQAQLSLSPLLPLSPTNPLPFLSGGKASLEESTESGRSSWSKLNQDQVEPSPTPLPTPYQDWARYRIFL